MILPQMMLGKTTPGRMKLEKMSLKETISRRMKLGQTKPEQMILRQMRQGRKRLEQMKLGPTKLEQNILEQTRSKQTIPRRMIPEQRTRESTEWLRKGLGRP